MILQYIFSDNTYEVFLVIWLNRFCMPWIEIFIFVSGQMAIYVIVCGGNIPFQLKKSLQTIIKHGSFKIKTPTQSFKILRNFGYYNKQRYTGVFSHEKVIIFIILLCDCSIMKGRNSINVWIRSWFIKTIFMDPWN